MILDLIDSNALTAHFQPIYSAHDGSVYGHESLMRTQHANPFGSISEIFDKAVQTGVISSLDMLCRENAFRQAAALGFDKQTARLFLNICPQTVMNPEHRLGATDGLAERYGIAKKKIILEITEQEAIRNYNLFKRSVDHYRERGYKIAIDDFGAGYGGLKMLSIIEPDFVKIDRHFITDIDKEKVKYNLVDSVATFCHKLGIKVIAEGIESQEELEVILHFGIDFLQGFHLRKPGAHLAETPFPIPNRGRERLLCLGAGDETCTISSIVRQVEAISSSAPAMDVFQRFFDDPELRGVPIIERGSVVTMLNRHRFLEQQMVGRLGFGFSLSSYKKVEEVMGTPCSLLVESTASLEDVARKVQLRKTECLYDDICVTTNGKYIGTVAVSDLLDAMTARSIALAKGANPLTGLPGNEFIQRTINKLLSQNVPFDVGYIDIDNFKAYNDYYGFEKGDNAIRKLGWLLVRALGGVSRDQFNFAGHIGGDDFIIISRPKHSMRIATMVVEAFRRSLREFHGHRECLRGHYQAKDRRGRVKKFPLMSLSVGIVSTELQAISSFAQLAFMASGVKKAAKQQQGFAIVRDRRLQGDKLHCPREEGASAVIGY